MPKMTQQKVTFKELLDRAVISQNELSREARVDINTVRKMARGEEKVRRLKALAVLRVLNERLRTTYIPEEIEGLKLAE